MGMHQPGSYYQKNDGRVWNCKKGALNASEVPEPNNILKSGHTLVELLATES